MLDITAFFADDPRVEVYRAGECDPRGTCILYWMQRAQRGRENAALNAAIAFGNTLNLPIVVLFVLTDYPAANLRHYHFMLEGLAVTAEHLQERGTPLVIRRGAPVEQVLFLAKELQAAAILSDESELRTPRAWRDEVKQHTTIPFACVDADVVVPGKFFPKEEWAARTIRPKIERILPTFLQPIVDLEPTIKLERAPCDPGAIHHPLSYLDTLKIDRAITPSSFFHGGQNEGKRLVHRFIVERLTDYSEQRNHPERAGTSELSAYLHFGHIAVQQVAWDIAQLQQGKTSTQSAQDKLQGGCAAYLEELIVRRELAINFARRNAHYDELQGCPDWAQKTLRKHASDPRAWNYSLAELEQAETHDELWNASQREMVASGRMHGYMRMYWAKKILEWVDEPEKAFSYAVYLNDTYELDGRDANGYTGIAWAIGGKHDRPWGPERPIFGLVRYMALSGMRRKMDIQAYISRWGR